MSESSYEVKIHKGRGKKIMSWSLRALAVFLLLWQGSIAHKANIAKGNAEWSKAKERERLELIIQSDPRAIIMCNKDHKITVSNIAAEEMFGWSHHEIMGKPISILLPKELNSKHEEAMDKATVSAKNQEGNWMFRRQLDADGIKRDGSIIKFRLNVRWIKYGEDIEFIAVLSNLDNPPPTQEKLPLPDIKDRIEESRENMLKEDIKSRSQGA